MMIHPWWPLVALATIQLADGLLCIKPVDFIRRCLIDVGLPERYWSALPPLKIAAAAGLIVGIWVQPLAIVTSAALVVYFLLAISAHLRARDLGRNLFVNAIGMLVLCVATLTIVVQA